MIGFALSTTAATMAGAVVGSVAHELSHAAAAVGVGGNVIEIGWRDGLTGGPVVIWESPQNTGWEPVVVGLAPVVGAVIAAVGVSLWRPTDAVGIGGAVGVLLGLLNLSREDVDPQQASDAAKEA